MQHTNRSSYKKQKDQKMKTQRDNKERDRYDRWKMMQNNNDENSSLNLTVDNKLDQLSLNIQSVKRRDSKSKTRNQNVIGSLNDRSLDQTDDLIDQSALKNFE